MSCTAGLLILLAIPRCLQIRRWVLDGRRPKVPPREALPGPDSMHWQGLDAYCHLMR